MIFVLTFLHSSSFLFKTFVGASVMLLHCSGGASDDYKFDDWRRSSVIKEKYH